MIYGELSQRFVELVTLFNDMSFHGDRSQDAGSLSTERMLILIEHYQRTHNPQVRDVLLRHGVRFDQDLKKS
jgi:hypothetical protein